MLAYITWCCRRGWLPLISIAPSSPQYFRKDLRLQPTLVSPAGQSTLSWHSRWNIIPKKKYWRSATTSTLFKKNFKNAWSQVLFCWCWSDDACLLRWLQLFCSCWYVRTGMREQQCCTAMLAWPRPTLLPPSLLPARVVMLCLADWADSLRKIHYRHWAVHSTVQCRTA